MRARSCRAHARGGRPRSEPARAGPGVARRHRRRGAGRPADRRHHLRRAAVPLPGACRPQVPALDGFVARPAAEPPVHARHVGLDLRRRLDQRDGDGRRAGASRSTTTPIYRHHPLFAQRPAHVWSDELGGPRALEGGDVLVIGNGCVLVGMGERTRPAGVERLAERSVRGRLGAPGDRRRHAGPALDDAPRHACMTMVDRDAFTIYPDVREALVGYSLRPTERRHRRARGRPVRRDRAGARRPGAAAVRDRRRPLRGPARAVGRRQQRAGRGAGRGRRLRAQRRHEHAAAARGDRGDHDRRVRARSRPRRSALACPARSSVTHSPTTPEVAGPPGQRRSTRGHAAARPVLVAAGWQPSAVASSPWHRSRPGPPQTTRELDRLRSRVLPGAIRMAPSSRACDGMERP